MKKELLLIAAFVGLTTAVSAQEEMGIFNHIGAGVEVGTTGIGFEIGSCLTDHVQVRAGLSVLPSFTVDDIDVDLNISSSDWAVVSQMPGSPLYGEAKPTNLLIAGKVTKTDGKFLVDIFPFKSSSFHVTTGFYVGSSRIIDVYNTNNQNILAKIDDYNEHPYPQVGEIGLAVGDYLITPDADGTANAVVKVNSFKPYVGIGFGRVVPKKTRLAFACDLGVQFWGTPEIWLQDTKLDKDTDIDGTGSIIKTISKITVYPCLNFRLTGRIL